MTDIEALAKLASEAVTEIEKLTWPAPDPYYPAFNAFIAAASPDVVRALVRVALAAREVVLQQGRYCSQRDVPAGALVVVPFVALEQLDLALGDLDR